MSQYDEVLSEAFKIYKQDDEKFRKSRGLPKIRSDIEAIQYRKQFDNFYTDTIKAMSEAVRLDFGRLNDSSAASVFVNDIELQQKFLEDYLVLPHALAKLLDYQTNSGGRITDIAKICNVFAILGIPSGVKIDETHEEYKKAFHNLLAGLVPLNILRAPFTEGGKRISLFLYWLIYDNTCGELNFNILIDLAKATNGSFSHFKGFMVGYWMIRKVTPDTSVNFFYKEILPNIK